MPSYCPECGERLVEGFCLNIECEVDSDIGMPLGAFRQGTDKDSRPKPF